ncbi:hypothetical protein [Natranaerobius trueperi]
MAYEEQNYCFNEWVRCRIRMYLCKQCKKKSTYK